MSVATPLSARALQHRVLTCLDKLSDRDTFSSAASELETIAISLSIASVPSFVSSVSLSSPSDKSPVRKLPLTLISLLSLSHGDALSPHLSRILSPVVARIRDKDASVRLAAASTVSSISRHVTKMPFTALVKPLLESLFTETDGNAQTGSALCVSAAIDSAPEPDFPYLIKLLPRLERLLKCEGFKGKAALLGVFGSVVGVGPGLGRAVVKNLVACFTECLGSEDWAVRKAAAEAMGKLAVVERDGIAEFKATGLKTIESKRFDKVKIVRETMNQLLEAWKEIPDTMDEVSPPVEPVSSSKDDARDGRFPPGSRKTDITTSVQKKSITPSITSTDQKRSPLDSNNKRSGPAMFRKLDRKKPTDRKIEAVTPSTTVAAEDAHMKRDLERDDKVPSRFSKQEIRRALFNQNEYSESTVVVSNVNEDIQRSQKECEDLSLIYKQLGHIEAQQSNLLDLLQKFMGSSQTGMRALETRVHGLELTLDDISYDMSLSNKKMPNSDSEGTSCCMLPGAEFLSPKFWRKTEPRHSVSPFSSSRGITMPMGAMRERGNRNANADDAFNLEIRRLRMQGRNGFIVNPLADLHSDSTEYQRFPQNSVVKNVEGVA